MIAEPAAMYDAVVDSAIEITAMGLGAVAIHRASIAAMIDPSWPGVLYGIAAVMVASSKLLRAYYDVEQSENWLEKKIKRLKPKRGNPDERDNLSAKRSAAPQPAACADTTAAKTAGE